MDTQVDNFVTLLENYKVILYLFIYYFHLFSHSSTSDITVQWPA